ncbi:MAG: hypothetical protein SOX10_00015 [Duodenibacillus sp.]|nr:hypothetical protein [Duodenibacillus sp.]
MNAATRRASSEGVSLKSLIASADSASSPKRHSEDARHGICRRGKLTNADLNVTNGERTNCRKPDVLII